jgi:hypothetical protein
LSFEDNSGGYDNFEEWANNNLNTEKFRLKETNLDYIEQEFGDYGWLYFTPYNRDIEYLDGGVVYYARIEGSKVVLFGAINLSGKYKEAAELMLTTYSP